MDTLFTHVIPKNSESYSHVLLSLINVFLFYFILYVVHCILVFVVIIWHIVLSLVAVISRSHGI